MTAWLLQRDVNCLGAWCVARVGHTVGNGPVVSRLVEAIAGEGVGDAREFGLD